MKRQYTILAILLTITIISTLYVYPSLPHLVPSHWNAAGQIDGYVSKSAHVIMFGLLMIGLPAFLLWIPRLDPKYASIKKFEDTFQWFVVNFELFFMVLYGYTMAVALGVQFPIMWVLIPAMSLLFYSIGNMLSISEQNYTIGIRTPWTLADPVIWKKTHELGSKTFTYGSILSLLTVFLGDYTFAAFFVIIMAESFIPVIYSYVLFQEMKKKTSEAVE